MPACSQVTLQCEGVFLSLFCPSYCTETIIERIKVEKVEAVFLQSAVVASQSWSDSGSWISFVRIKVKRHQGSSNNNQHLFSLANLAQVHVNLSIGTLQHVIKPLFEKRREVQKNEMEKGTGNVSEGEPSR